MKIRWAILMLSLLATPAIAALYKIVSSDGSVTYSDVPPSPPNEIAFASAKQKSSEDTRSISEQAASELMNQIRNMKTNELLRRKNYTQSDHLKKLILLEQENLNTAKAELTRRIERPRTVRAVVINPDGESQPGYLPLYSSSHRRIQELQEKINLHQQNIVILQQRLMSSNKIDKNPHMNTKN